MSNPKCVLTGFIRLNCFKNNSMLSYGIRYKYDEIFPVAKLTDCVKAALTIGCDSCRKSHICPILPFNCEQVMLQKDFLIEKYKHCSTSIVVPLEIEKVKYHESKNSAGSELLYEPFLPFSHI